MIFLSVDYGPPKPIDSSFVKPDVPRCHYDTSTGEATLLPDGKPVHISCHSYFRKEYPYPFDVLHEHLRGKLGYFRGYGDLLLLPQSWGEILPVERSFCYGGVSRLCFPLARLVDEPKLAYAFSRIPIDTVKPTERGTLGTFRLKGFRSGKMEIVETKTTPARGVGITWAQVNHRGYEYFCLTDGGRVLPTELINHPRFFEAIDLIAEHFGYPKRPMILQPTEGQRAESLSSELLAKCFASRTVLNNQALHLEDRRKQIQKRLVKTKHAVLQMKLKEALTELQKKTDELKELKTRQVGLSKNTLKALAEADITIGKVCLVNTRNGFPAALQPGDGSLEKYLKLLEKDPDSMVQKLTSVTVHFNKPFPVFPVVGGLTPSTFRPMKMVGPFKVTVSSNRLLIEALDETILGTSAAESCWTMHPHARRHAKNVKSTSMCLGNGDSILEQALSFGDIEAVLCFLMSYISKSRLDDDDYWSDDTHSSFPNYRPELEDVACHTP